MAAGSSRWRDQEERTGGGMKIETVGVVGSGTMGNGIAHTAALHGRNVILNDIEAPLLERAMRTIDQNLKRGVEKGRMTADEKAAVLGRIEATTDLSRLARADFIIEAIFENETAKKDLFACLDGIARLGVVL